MTDTDDRWEQDESVTCVVCPVCAFTFDAVHADVADSGRYSCPLCAEARLEAEVERLQAIVTPLRDLDIDGVRHIVSTRHGAGIWRDEQVDALDRLHERWMEHVDRLVARVVSPDPTEEP